MPQLPPLAVTHQPHLRRQPCEAVGRHRDLTVTTNGGQVPRDCQRPVLWQLWAHGGIAPRLPKTVPSTAPAAARRQISVTPPQGIYKESASPSQARLSGRRSPAPADLSGGRPPLLSGPRRGGLAGAAGRRGGAGGRPRAVLLGGAVQLDARWVCRPPPHPTHQPRGHRLGAQRRRRSLLGDRRALLPGRGPTPTLRPGDALALWGVRHGFIASAADQGALIRVRACYTPPDVPAPPCVTGPATRLNVLQQSALPAFTAAPRSLLVTAGQPTTFTATAGGAPAPTLQWQTRAANDAGAWSDVTSGTGATTGSYTTAALALADNGRQYRVVATNAPGRAESPAVTASVSDADVAPTITTQPAGLSVATGSDAAFAVVAPAPRRSPTSGAWTAPPSPGPPARCCACPPSPPAAPAPTPWW